MKLVAALAAVLVVAFTAASPAQSQQTAATAPGNPTLYKRLGGYDALAAVTDDFLARLAGDPGLGRFFAGHSSDSIKRIRQLIVDQLCSVTGGPCAYIGRDMKTTHAGLAITEKDWDTMVKLFVATLDKFDVPAKEKDDALASVAALKKDIVEKP